MTPSRSYQNRDVSMQGLNSNEVGLKYSLLWRQNERDGVSNHQPHHCLPNRLFRCRSKKTSKFRVTGLCEGNSPVAGEFPAQRTTNAENVSISWRHHVHRVFVHFPDQHTVDHGFFSTHVVMSSEPCHRPDYCQQIDIKYEMRSQ